MKTKASRACRKQKMFRIPPDSLIRTAVEADIRQYLIDSLTPSRRYDVPIDHVKRLFSNLNTGAETGYGES